MKIVHVMECFAGGTFEFLVQLTQKLNKIEHIIIYGIRENTPKDFKKKFPLQTIFVPWKMAQREINFIQDIKALTELISIIKEIENKDIIHLHSSKAGFLGRIAACLIGLSRKTIYTAHGVSFLRTDVSKGKKQIYILLEKMANWCGGQIIACSKSEGEEFQRYGIKNVRVIHNGIEIIDILLKELNKEIIVGTIARISSQKNPSLFNWIAQQYQENRQVKFLWIGDGELRAELRATNIEITGWISKQSVKKQLQRVDIYLSTSLWEGLPLGVLEAMVQEKPVVLSDCVGNKDLVENKLNGFLFRQKEEALEGLNFLVNDCATRYQYGRESRQKAIRFFSLDKMSSEYLNIYKKISSTK